jgi:hypothetical protein
MPPAHSIQEGGCTTPPRRPLTELRDPNVLSVLALLSPIAVLVAWWMTRTVLGPGVEALSVMLRVALITVAVALAVCGLALWRAKDRETTMLSLIGLVGNVLVVAVGAVYLSLR